jgi:alpha-glucosidase (family GH31 glycosyl hydrolase)
MYGVVPMIQVKKEGQSHIDAILWANSSDTFVDIFDDPNHKDKRVIHWMSESGSLDFFILSSESPQEVT